MWKITKKKSKNFESEKAQAFGNPAGTVAPTGPLIGPPLVHAAIASSTCKLQMLLVELEKKYING